MVCSCRVPKVHAGNSAAVANLYIMTSSEPILPPLPAPIFTTRSGRIFAFLPDGERLVVSGTGPKSVSRIISLVAGQDLLVFDKPPQSVRGNAVSTDGKTVALAAHHDRVTLYDSQTGQKQQSLKVGNDVNLSGLEFVPGSHDLLHSSWGGLTALEADENGNYTVRPLRTSLPFPDNTMYYAIAFAASGNRFACLWSSHTVGTNISLYAWPPGDEIARLPCRQWDHSYCLDQIIFTPGDQSLLLTAPDGSIMLWPLVGGEPTGSSQLWLAGPAALSDVGKVSTVHSGRLCFSQDGTLLAAGLDNTLGLWAWPSGECLGEWRLPSSDPIIYQIGFSPTGLELAASRYGSNISVYRVADLLNTRNIYGNQ